MTHASAEQLQIIDAPLTSMSVIACAGSGKTFTAVRRLAQIRRQLGDHRARVALLSFSNIAVDTFRREYQGLVQRGSTGGAQRHVEIATLDAFIAENILRPHAYRTMDAQRAAFLVTGGEAFLHGFKFNTGAYPREISALQVGIENGVARFYYLDRDDTRTLDTTYATQIVQRLGHLGAYTHNLGRYWCYRTLVDQPGILRAFVRRYPFILIDEAQDIGTAHQAIIELLIGAGCQVSLIGDPNQGIYEFAGANGIFLTQYGQRAGVTTLGLTRNYRSVPAILHVANRLSARADTADRAAPVTPHGAFFVPYRTANQDNLVAAFHTAVVAAGLNPEQSAVLCRSRSMTNRLAGNDGAPGQGMVKSLAQAAILRDGKKDFFGAYRIVAPCIIGLLVDPPHGLVAKIISPTHHPDARKLGRLVWAFTRDAGSGLPAATLQASTQWHPRLLDRTKALLTTIERDCGMASIDHLGNKLAKKGLTNDPLITAADLAATSDPARMRVDTVHQAKGESLDAVLYLASREHVNALLSGVGTEVGRIGYVAITRARDLLWLGIPANALKELRPKLLAAGLKEANAATHA